MDPDGGHRRARDHGRQPARPPSQGAVEGPRRPRDVYEPRGRGGHAMSLFTREMACQELVELLPSYFDGTLSRSDRRRFRAHISGCDHCTAYVEQMRLVSEASGRLTEDDIDPAARDELLDAFRGWKDER